MGHFRVSFILAAVASAFLPYPLIGRLARNALTPALPRPIEPRYKCVEDERLAHDVTVIVGTKDTLSPTLAQLRHLADALPSGMRVIYTYPLPPWEEAKAYARRLRDAAGPDLARRMRLLPVDGFSNPFDAWLRALPLVRTKYTLLMHNDVFLIDGRGHLLSELHGALEAHPQHAVAAPQIYETEFRGLLTTHLFNTNLHLRLNAEGVAFMSHEVDLLTGLAREPSDFEQRPNDHFLEDHVFLVRTDAATGTDFIDPKAAFTLEYVDLHLNMLRNNLTQLYVPSARAEFRLWEFGWQDVPYFVRRRSEEQARLTKRHLETKWGVEVRAPRRTHTPHRTFPSPSRAAHLARARTQHDRTRDSHAAPSRSAPAERAVPKHRLLQFRQVQHHPPRQPALARVTLAVGRPSGALRLVV